MSNVACRQCGAKLAAGQWLCAECGTQVEDDSDRTVLRSSATGPKSSAGQASGEVITSVPGMSTSPGTATVSAVPPLTADLPSPGRGNSGPPVFINPTEARQSLSPRQLALCAAAVLALLGVGVGIGRLTSDDKAASPIIVASTVVESAIVPSTAVESTIATTSDPTTVPATEPPVTVPQRPPWPAPPIPEPPVFAGGGLAYAISDPLVSGMPSDQPTPYLAFAQGVFDKMAADDWPGVQNLFFFQPPGGEAVPFTFDLQQQWPTADRLSLLLVDAAPDATGLSGYDLTVAVVANFAGSTSVLCGHLYSDPTTEVRVIQRGEFQLLADGLSPTMPESLLNDPAQVADLETRCK